MLQFLNPENITYHNQPAIDISANCFSLPFNGKYKTVQLKYYCKEKIQYPFPENTHGHLYYCTPPQDRPPLSGFFRIRVLPSTSDHPKSFAEGTDLLRPDGRPWELPLYNAIHRSIYAPLVQKLLNENLIDTDLHDTVAKLPRINLRNPSGVLYTLSDPFVLPLGQAKALTIITEENLVTFRIRLIDLYLGRSPFTGILLSNISRRISFIFILSQVLYLQDSRSWTNRNICASVKWSFAFWRSCLLSNVLFQVMTITSSCRKQAN